VRFSNSPKAQLALAHQWILWTFVERQNEVWLCDWYGIFKK